nr:hypothetical protein [Tanacetum cinerariifolium]
MIAVLNPLSSSCLSLMPSVIIMVNVIPPDHVDDVPIVEPKQHDDIPEHVLVDEDEDSKEEEPQEEDDMEVDIEEDDVTPPNRVATKCYPGVLLHFMYCTRFEKTTSK